jgi:hypothetical protein
MAIVPNGDKVAPFYLDPHIPSKMELCGAGRGFQVVPSDTVNNYIKGFTAETAGDVAIVNYDNSVSVLTVVAGQTVPIVAKRINAAGTTATVVGIR